MTYDLSEFDPTAVDLSKYTKIVIIKTYSCMRGSLKATLQKDINNVWRAEFRSALSNSDVHMCKLCGTLYKEEQSREHSGCKELHLPTGLVPKFILEHKYDGYDTIVFE